MRRYQWLLVVVSLVFAVSGCKTAAPETESVGEEVLVEQGALVSARVLKAIEARVEAGEYPGIVVAVSSGGRSKVYSFGEMGNGVAVDGDTLFEIGSVTKTFTATLLAQAVVDGKVSLGDLVYEAVPGLKLTAGPDGRSYTLGELASQYSGLPRLPANMKDVAGDNPYKNYGVSEMKEFLASYEMTRSPGSSYEYSNLGYGLLGYVLGELAGSTYDAQVQARIFEPLGMTDSEVHRANADSAKLATGHKPYGGGEAAGWDFDAMAGGGSILSSGNDMLRYLEANMQAQSGAGEGDIYQAMALAHRPLVEGPAAGQHTGLAWIEQGLGDEKIVFHNGMTGGFASFMGFSDDGSRGVVILTNVQASVDDLGSAVLGSETPLRAARTSYSMTPDEIAELSGNYQLGENAVLRVFQDFGALYVQVSGQGPVPVFASKKDRLFSTFVDIELEVERDKAGKISGLVLHQNGEHRAPRISDTDADALKNRKEIQLSAEALAEYVGSYVVDPKLAPGMTFEVSFGDGKLLVRLTGQDVHPVYASGNDVFFYRVVDATIQFERDESGAVTGLVLHQSGQKIPARR